MASIKPLGQRVLVKRLDAEEVSAGGIVLPDTAQEKPQEAEVVALGTGGKLERDSISARRFSRAATRCSGDVATAATARVGTTSLRTSISLIFCFKFRNIQLIGFHRPSNRPKDQNMYYEGVIST